MAEERRCANYKPNIWKDHFLISRSTQFNNNEYKMNIENLKDVIKDMFLVTDWITKLELVNQIDLLCLTDHFEIEIKETIDGVMLMYHNDFNVHKIRHGDLYGSALSLRILRQYGFKVSQDVFRGFVDKEGDNDNDLQELIEIFEASHLGSECESLLDNAKILSTKLLENKFSNIKQTREALQLPLNRRVLWYDLKRRISNVKNSDEVNIVLLNLAKLNFNIVQANHHQELGILIRWWRNLGLMEHLSFTRDRVVESYLWSVGVNYEPQHKSFRKWLTKAITMVLVIDDVYDLFGSFKELECFTKAIIRWDLHEVELLPNCMKVCLEALYSLTEEMALEMQTEKGWQLVLPHLRNGWTGFCKALFVEAKWYNEGYTPTLEEYLDNGLVSSCGPLLSLITFFSFVNEVQEESVNFLLQDTKDIVHHISIIVRLCNDIGTYKAEQERGDSPSSILCFMKETKLTESFARDHIESLISETWKTINGISVNYSPILRPFIKCVNNIARVAHFIYHAGDGFGIQDGETKKQVISSLMVPFTIEG